MNEIGLAKQSKPSKPYKLGRNKTFSLIHYSCLLQINSDYLQIITTRRILFTYKFIQIFHIQINSNVVKQCLQIIFIM